MTHIGQHLLALLLIAGFPLWDAVQMGYARRHRTHAVRVGVYATIVAVLWLASAWAAALTGTIFMRASSTGAPHWSIPRDAIAGLAVGFLLAVLSPAVAAYRSERTAKAFAKGLKSMDFLMPRSAGERAGFAVVSVSAGVCEEILYRGYLLHYGVAVLRLPAAAALALSVAAFGVAHAYQGGKGIVQTGLVGVVLMGVYLGCGVLWPAMLLHGAMDLRVALLPERAMPA